MKFNYQARTREGEIKSGTIEAISRESALELLARYNLIVVNLEKEEEEVPWYARRLKFLERVSQKEIVIFARQLSVLFSARISLVEALRTLARQTKNLAFRAKILKIADDVDGGAPFSEALARHPEVFPPFYVNMVRSGEVSGKLSEVLEYLANHTERDYQLISKIRGSMVYPAFVLFSFCVVVVIMMVFVIPQLTIILKESGQELPLTTKIVVAVSDFLRAALLYLIIFIPVFLLGGWRFFKTPTGKKFFDRVSLKIPVFGEISQKMYLARFAENLSTLILGGIPIASALTVVGDIIGNSVYKKIILEAREAVKRGDAISSTFARYRQMPPLVIQMISIGEETGNLDDTLMSVADFYQKEVDNLVNSLVSLIEPILIIVLGIGVGVLVTAILMPIYNLAGAL